VSDLGFAEGDRLSVRIEGDEVILRKAPQGNWREWNGRLKESNLLADLADGWLQELAHDRH
jgi:bifunctional DNA-binding transcriptional regulator/antitoxin component of YhaV-PrlF toxin-antitoxin module